MRLVAEDGSSVEKGDIEYLANRISNAKPQTLEVRDRVRRDLDASLPKGAVPIRTLAYDPRIASIAGHVFSEGGHIDADDASYLLDEIRRRGQLNDLLQLEISALKVAQAELQNPSNPIDDLDGGKGGGHGTIASFPAPFALLENEGNGGSLDPGTPASS